MSDELGRKPVDDLRRSTTLPRSAGGFRLMNSRPLLTAAAPPEPPTEEPTPATAGSASTIVHGTCCCRSASPGNEMSVEAWVTPKIEAGIVLREIAFRGLDVEETVSAMVATNPIRVSAR